MTDVEKFVQALQILIDNAEDALINAVRSHQSRTIKKIIAAIRRRKEGLILKRGMVAITGKDGTANRRRLREIRRELDKIINSEAIRKAFDKYSDAITEIEKLSAAYYSNNFPSFTRAQTREIAKEAASRTIQNLSNGLQVLSDPIKQILTVASPTALNDMVEDLQEGITEFTQKNGTPEIKVRGHLERFVNNEILANGGTRQSLVRDSLHGFSRELTNVVTENLGLEWYIYLGGLVRDSRDFCEERNGNYYHESEVEKWASESWPEKITGTNRSNIKQRLGGYNCRHTLQPVPRELVPKKDLERIEG